jgi:peptidyl-prolyl cis-trans isomerase SurA
LEKKADSTLFRGNLRLKEKELNKPLLSFADKRYTVRDFRSHLVANSGPAKGRDPKRYLREQLDKMAEEQLLDYEDTRLEAKHNDFRLLMNEYHDGILLFELTDKKVWNKAIRDTTGLAEFHKANSRNYMWQERVKCVIYSFATPEMAREFRKTMGAKNNKKTAEEIINNLNRDKALNASRETGTFSMEEREVLIKIDRKPGMSSDINHNGRVFIVDVQEVLAPSPKSLDEAKGQVTADYQTHLEKLWVEELRSKYKWSVNKDILYTIK